MYSCTSTQVHQQLRALEELAGHADIFDKPQLPLFVRDLDIVVQLGVQMHGVDGQLEDEPEEQRVEDSRDGRGCCLQEEDEGQRVTASEDSEN